MSNVYEWQFSAPGFSASGFVAPVGVTIYAQIQDSSGAGGARQTIIARSSVGVSEVTYLIGGNPFHTGEYTVVFDIDWSQFVYPIFVMWDDGVSQFTEERKDCPPNLLNQMAIELAALSAKTGTGAFTVSITVTDTLDNPLQNARVRYVLSGVSKAYGTTDVNGVVTFNLDAGVYSVAITCDGYQYSGGTDTVVGDKASAYEMTPNSITPSPTGTVTGYFIAYDDMGNPAEGIEYSCRQVSYTTPGNSYSSSSNVIISGVGGLTSVPGMFPGETYLLTRGSAFGTVPTKVTIASDATENVQLPASIGTP